MGTAAVQERRLATRVVRKFQCSSMVTGLAKSWQTWANKNAERLDSVPVGWVPDSVKEDVEREKRVRSELKLMVTPRAVEANGGDDGGEIRTGVVTRSVEPERNICGIGLVSTVKEKIDGGHLGTEEAKPFLGGESPTRRRHCLSKASGGLRAWAQLEEEAQRMGSRSSSLDTEDSGLGEEGGHSDNSNNEQESLRKSKPKVGLKPC